jgi:hypothetical protein
LRFQIPKNQKGADFMHEKYSEELLCKHFGAPDGYTSVESVVIRLYTLLDGFDITTAGLYLYLRSWRSTREDTKGLVWHSREYMYAQTGIGRKAFDARLKTLIKYELVTPIQSPYAPNKQNFIIHDPLTRDEFIRKYPEAVEKFLQKVEEIEARNIADRQRREEIKRQKLIERVQSAQKGLDDDFFESIKPYL